MANFEEALKKTLYQEGGLVSNPEDHDGGITNLGISLRFLKSINPLATADAIKNLTLDAATEIYKSQFWNKYNYSAITSQTLANLVFSIAVNTGPTHTHKALQRCLRAVNGTIINDDGLLGMQTLSAINAAKVDSVLMAFRSQIDCYYRSLNQPNFLAGWLNRLYS